MISSNEENEKEIQDDDINSFPSSNLNISSSVSYSSQNCLQYEDISDLTIIGFDPSRMRDWNPFSIKSNHIKWISTGMIPQLLIINLKQCWYITEVFLSSFLPSFFFLPSVLSLIANYLNRLQSLHMTFKKYFFQLKDQF